MYIMYKLLYPSSYNTKMGKTPQKAPKTNSKQSSKGPPYDVPNASHTVSHISDQNIK